MYVFIRTDLSVPQQIVQSAHAAIAAANAGLIPSKNEYLVVCGVRNEFALLKVHHQLLSQGIEHKVFREPDLNNSITAIATRQVADSERSLFKKYQVLQSKEVA